MITAVDSSVLIDILIGDPKHGEASATALRQAGARGAVLACDVVWAEVAAWYGSASQMRADMEDLGIAFSPIDAPAAERAGAAWAMYRRGGGKRTRVIADFLIGAHASLMAEALLTRDRGFQRRYFRSLPIIEPDVPGDPMTTPPVVTPLSLAEAYALMAEDVHRPVAGGTDLMVQLAAEVAEPPARVIDLWRLDELRGIEYDGYEVSIGALTTHAQLRHSPVVRARLPALAEAAATVGAAQIQNRGTIGGNIVNASPAGDTLPVLLAVDATFTLGSAAGERAVRASDFWVAYRRTALRRDELLLRVGFPVERHRHTRFRKVGTRQAQAISKVVMALSYREDGGVSRDVRLALGSVAATPIRARETEAVLEGAAPRETTADHAAAVLAEELSPIDDVRSTADYRRAVSARVLHRMLREQGGW